MTTTCQTVGPAYASGYVRGRHAAKEHFHVKHNPFRPGTSAYQGWSDGHFDERHSAHLWSNDDRN